MFSKLLGASPRTTVAAMLTLLGALCYVIVSFIDGDPETKPDWAQFLAALKEVAAAVGLSAASYGLFAARDNKTTSEQAAAKK